MRRVSGWDRWCSRAGIHIFCLWLGVGQVVLTGGCVLREELLNNALIVTDVGWPVPHLIFAGKTKRV